MKQYESKNYKSKVEAEGETRQSGEVCFDVRDRDCHLTVPLRSVIDASRSAAAPDVGVCL